jgi:hypothetical protein
MRVESGKWRVGKWRVESGKWRVESEKVGKWESGKWRVESGEWVDCNAQLK